MAIDDMDAIFRTDCGYLWVRHGTLTFRRFLRTTSTAGDAPISDSRGRNRSFDAASLRRRHAAASSESDFGATGLNPIPIADRAA